MKRGRKPESKKPDHLDLAALRGNLHAEILTFALRHGPGEALSLAWKEMLGLVEDFGGRFKELALTIAFDPPGNAEKKP